MSEWRELAIEDVAAKFKAALATGPFGSAVSSRHFVDDGIPMIRGSNLSTDVGIRLKDEGMVFLGHDVVSKFERSTVRSGDLVFTCWGTIGQIGLIDETCKFDRYIVSNKQMKLTPDPEIADSRFLYYSLSSPGNLDQVQRQATGSAVPGFNLGQLRKIRVSLPSLETQRSIASILSSIDNLIENNQRRIEVLEEMAQVIFREWFVHFRYRGHDDASFVGSPLGPIPEHWEVETLGGASSLLKRGSAPKYADDGPWRVVNQRCIRAHRVDLGTSRRSSRAPTDERRLRRGDVLVNSTGVGTLGRVAVLRDDSDDLTADTHVTIIRPISEAQNPWFGLALVDMESVFESMGAGSTGQTELSRKLLDALPIVIPPATVIREFAERVQRSIDLGFSLGTQNNRLDAIRDLLLPKLVTGEIDVSKLDLDTLVSAS